MLRCSCFSNVDTVFGVNVQCSCSLTLIQVHCVEECIKTTATCVLKLLPTKQKLKCPLFMWDCQVSDQVKQECNTTI